MSESEPAYATVEAIAGLASEVDGLRRRIETLDHIRRRVDELATLVDQLAAHVNTTGGAAEPEPVPSWLMLPADRSEAGRVLGELVAWLHAVLLRYSDAAAALPECWMWHPDVVEELLWLMHTWLAAYQGERASIALAADWHDRYRPGVIRRIKTVAGACSLENHSPPAERTPVPLSDAAERIAAWWAGHRDEPAPEPTEEQFAATRSLRRGGGGRR
ncbi:hypothetical protein SAMN06265360_101317 [Haloechinothrix alba]|uniref:DUF4913 domain-containing protein n=1 Tax=Haloechinothrix alba TaxID=664784 RepID=A0A238V6N2_9PSEU|nr:hypothetical protein [Haloechinothrix alba]SNR29179.1 hypothetical protein SAMN06265360_101317 [Haloechinothrix alba]